MHNPAAGRSSAVQGRNRTAAQASRGTQAGWLSGTEVRISSNDPAKSKPGVNAQWNGFEPDRQASVSARSTRMASVFASRQERNESNPGEPCQKNGDGEDVQHRSTSVRTASGMNTAISSEANAMPDRS
jgi:hypothetical protein